MQPMTPKLFRRALAVDPVIMPVALSAVATRVDNSKFDSEGVTSFEIHNPNPFPCWYRGWTGAQGSMPTIVDKGHFIKPGETQVKQTQKPDWIAAVPSTSDPAFPYYADDGTTPLYPNKAFRLVMLYGSGGPGASSSGPPYVFARNIGGGSSSGGSVTVANTPLPVSDNNSSLTVDGTVNVGNFPATQPVSGSVSVSNLPVTQPVSGTVSVGNFPSSQAVSGTLNVGNFPATQAISGNVSVTGALPAGTNALGSVTVSNFPATQPVSGSVSVSNFPATQPVSGSVNVGNFPANQVVTNRGTGSMATGQVAMSAGNTPYLVAAARASRRSITFVPTSQFTYFYGNVGVSATTGAAAPNGAAITLETTAAVYVVSGSTGTMTFVEHF